MPIILDSDIVFIRNDIYIMCICIIRISNKFGQYTGMKLRCTQ